MVGQNKCTSHQNEGLVSDRWVSFARIGWPLTDFFPETTQLLLAPAAGRVISPSMRAAASRAVDAMRERAGDSGGMMKGARSGQRGKASLNR